MPSPLPSSPANPVEAAPPLRSATQPAGEGASFADMAQAETAGPAAKTPAPARPQPPPGPGALTHAPATASVTAGQGGQAAASRPAASGAGRSSSTQKPALGSGEAGAGRQDGSAAAAPALLGLPLVAPLQPPLPVRGDGETAPIAGSASAGAQTRLPDASTGLIPTPATQPAGVQVAESLPQSAPQGLAAAADDTLLPPRSVGRAEPHLQPLQGVRSPPQAAASSEADAGGRPATSATSAPASPPSNAPSAGGGPAQASAVAPRFGIAAHAPLQPAGAPAPVKVASAVGRAVRPATFGSAGPAPGAATAAAAGIGMAPGASAAVDTAASDDDVVPSPDAQDGGASAPTPDLAGAQGEAPAVATAAPAPVGAAPRPGVSPTVAGLAAAVASRLDGRTSRFDVALDPAGLGHVDVRLEIGADGRASAALAFDRPEAAALVQAHAGALRHALAQSGLDLPPDALSFDVAGGGAGGFSPGAQTGGGGAGERPPGGALARAGAFAQASAALDTSPPAYAAAAARRGVDIRI